MFLFFWLLVLAVWVFLLEKFVFFSISLGDMGGSHWKLSCEWEPCTSKTFLQHVGCLCEKQRPLLKPVFFSSLMHQCRSSWFLAALSFSFSEHNINWSMSIDTCSWRTQELFFARAQSQEAPRQAPGSSPSGDARKIMCASVGRHGRRMRGVARRGGVCELQLWF